MHFELSEKEFHGLESCQQQIGFMSDLCTYVEGVQSVSITGLMHFLDAQNAALKAVVKAAEERQDAQIALRREVSSQAAIPASPIPHCLLVRVMEVCSGVQMSDEEIVQIYDELFDVTTSQGQAELLQAFHAALYRLGYQVSYAQSESGTQFSISAPKAKTASLDTKKPQPAKRSRAKDRLVASN